MTKLRLGEHTESQAQTTPIFRYLADSKAPIAMEATFIVDAQEDRMQFADRLAKFFEGKTIRVYVKEVETKAVSQQHLLKRMEALQLRTEQVPVTMPPGLDMNDIIDDLDDNSL